MPLTISSLFGGDCRAPGIHNETCSFQYFASRTLDEALALLADHGDEGKIRQSLVPAMNFRLACPTSLIDINRIAALDYIRESDGKLYIGALARHAEFEVPLADGCST